MSTPPPLVDPRERAVPSVPAPPWEPLAHDDAFERVDAAALEARRRKARSVHQLRVAARQGLGGKPAAEPEGVAPGHGAADSSSDEGDRAATDGATSEQHAATLQSSKSDASAGRASTGGGSDFERRHVDPTAGTASDERPSASPSGSPTAAKSAASSSTTTTTAVGDAGVVEIPRPRVIERHLAAGGRLRTEDARAIIVAATRLFEQEPNVLQVAGPVTVCGDVHGQFYDVLNIFGELGGDPDSTQYLFLGDYVDRGSYSTEIVLTLFARKIVRPSSLWLLRGNHECSYLTSYFNFRQECLHKYDEATYELFLKAFNCLPLAAVINGEFLCVHGGLSPFIRTVEDIQTIHRFRDPPQRGPMCDLLWADPMDEEEEELFPDALFLHNELRGCSYVYTHAAAADFLQRNGLAAIIRAHEAQEEGFRMYRKVASTGMPATICVFSAPNYCEFNNLAAILMVDGRQLQVKQFHSSPQPYCLPQFMNAFSWSVPFVFEKVDHILADLIEATDDDPSGGMHHAGAIVNQAQPGSSGTATSTLAARIAGSLRTKREAERRGAQRGQAPAEGESTALSQATRLALLAAHLSNLLLPRFLRRRGRYVRAKVIAVVRFRLLLARLRQASSSS